MMDLILWRHAEAEDGVPDIERALTAKGIKQAARMAKWLRRRLPDDALILASPARRTRQTAQALTPDFKVVDEIGTRASPEDILHAAGWPHDDRTVVVVGHQPTLGATAALLLAGRSEEWGIRKGAIIWLAHRDHDGGNRAQLRAALSPDLL
ncbi:MAG TPA: histidine phosphatase family protein [Burkholderiales bacterium]|nr:histidine phosphatase family protein [Burkholderiales bacterium]